MALEEPDRNPSPPPEILGNENLVPDRIGNSLYSKKWLLKTLMTIVELCEKSSNSRQKKEKSCDGNSVPSCSRQETDIKPSNNFTEEAGDSKSLINPKEGKTSDSVSPIKFTEEEASCSKSLTKLPEDDATNKTPTESVEDKDKNAIMELDPKIEEDVCTLWDMSTNREVADFLLESGVPGIFLDVIDKTTSPRLLEIVVGILGNMSSFDTIGENIASNKTLLYCILMLTGTSDTPSLLQVFRLILCGISNKKTKKIWFDAFKEHSFFMENMKFIFENSLSSTVIRGAYQLIYSILNESLDYCEMWGQNEHLMSIITAGKQLLKSEDSMDNFFCVLNSLCQFMPNVENLVEQWKELNGLFTPFFLNLGEEEALPNRLRITAIFSCFDTYNTLLKSENMKREILVIDIDVLKAMCKMSNSVNDLILDIRKDNMAVLDLENPNQEPPRRFLRRIEIRNGTQYITMMSEYEFRTWTVLADTMIDTARSLLNFAEKENEREILEDILTAEIVKENIGILII